MNNLSFVGDIRFNDAGKEQKLDLSAFVKLNSNTDFTVANIEALASIGEYNTCKFVVQSFTKSLERDFKVFIFNDFSYLIKRENRPNDFRASGGGYNSLTGEFELPQGLLDYAYSLFEKFDCPYVSLDMGINENGFNLIEFQFVSFGTLANCKSKFYLERVDGEYLKKENNLSIEYLYCYSLNAFLN